MTTYKPSAVITALDTPKAGWYQASTSFGATVSGVRLKGTDKQFTVGQRVAVYQVGSEYGFSELGDYISQLAVPGSLLPAIASEAPNNVALAYIAKLAGNFRKNYKASKIDAVISDTQVRADNKTLQSAVKGFSAGDGCLIQIYPGKPSKVLGWWQSVPSGLPAGVPAICISRIPYSSSVDMVMYIGNEAIKSIKLSKYPDTEYVDAAWVETLRTSDVDDYFYSHVRMFRIFGAAYEDHYVRWHKINFTVEHITDLEYNGLVATQPAYTTTADEKYWHWSYPTPPAGTESADWCYISDTPDGVKTPVFNSGVLLDPGAWFPVKGYNYGSTTP